MKLRRILSTLTVASLCTFAWISNSAEAAPNLDKGKSDVAAFWSADKINKAIAFDMVFEKGAKSANRVPVAKGVSKSTGSTTTSILGSSWNNGGLPLSASGKVFFAIDNSYYQCSGALVQEDKTDRAIVLTAGHCVYDNETSKYVTNWIFIPSYDINQVSISGCTASNGCWAASNIYANSGFTSQTSFTTQATLYDWGFARITELKNGALPDSGGLNSFPISFFSLSKGVAVSSFGYPAAGKYNGKDLIYSSGALGFDANNANQTYSLASDMTGGCSGGPWLTQMKTSSPYSGTLSSVNSYKYGTTTYIYGPKFNTETQVTFNSALGI